MIITAQHPERQGCRPGQGMEKRLLLHRIALHPRHVAERDSQLAVLVEAHAANPVAPGGDQAAVATGDTTNPLPLGLPQRTDGRVTAKRIGQRLAGRAGLD